MGAKITAVKLNYLLGRVKWLVESTPNREYLGSIPAPSKLLLENLLLRIFFGVSALIKRTEDKSCKEGTAANRRRSLFGWIIGSKLGASKDF